MIYKNRTHASTECELSLLIWIQSAFSPATVPRAWAALPDWLLTCTWTDYHLSFAERKFFFKERCSDFRPPEHSVMLKEAYSNTGAGDSATFLSPLFFFFNITFYRSTFFSLQKVMMNGIFFFFYWQDEEDGGLSCCLSPNNSVSDLSHQRYTTTEQVQRSQDFSASAGSTNPTTPVRDHETSMVVFCMIWLLFHYITENNDKYIYLLHGSS